MVLSELGLGQSASVKRLGDQSMPLTLKRRLMALGFTTGSEVQMVRSAPLGGAVQLKVRGASLCLNNRLAAQIHVEG
ncbi:ferrous iron transport protein A [Ferrimonas sediminum]|uniref:Ferrous iron transport protein A n=1 Tax=Ferrimonas sediminum TaxID=718193 RepID=A0A1G8RAN2_9GAMM|nr:FeoA family protein [Ferrimonas sediminum]SDJ13913.1 ferrous iron transport protein A [Ferrimonas sediminum]